MKLTTIKSFVAAAMCAVGITAVAAPEGAVQLWKDGPYWATSNLGESEVQDHPEYGALYKFDDAGTAVKSLLGDEWRVPSKDDFEKLVNDEYCTKTWDSTKQGYTFTGKGDYSSNSIFLPAAGYDYGRGRLSAEDEGNYWTSEVREGPFAWFILLSDGFADMDYEGRDTCRSVRAVRDTPLPPPGVVVTDPTVTVDKVETGDPWSKVTVNYTLAGTDAKLEYKVAFDVTAGRETASVTNDAAKLADGAATKEIDTVTLFGKQVSDTKAKVKVTLIALKPKDLGGVQLWKDGPFWAETNLGESEVAGHPEYGALYKFDEAGTAVKSLLGDEWRVPSDQDLKDLIDTSKCTKEWDGTRKGYIFTGATEGYKDKSIFLPAAGYDRGSGRDYAGVYGLYWSSEARVGTSSAWRLYFYGDNALVDYLGRSSVLSVRAVR